MSRFVVALLVPLALCVACEPTGATRLTSGGPVFAASEASGSDCVGGVYKTGLVAVPDLAGGTYTDPDGGIHPGGLYSTGRNARPPALDAAAPVVTPVNGVIGVTIIGASTALIVGDSLTPILKSDPLKNPAVKFANAGKGGTRIDQWADPNNQAWSSLTSDLAAAGIALSQLRVVLIMAEQQATGALTFANQVAQNTAWIESTITNIRTKYPNAAIVYGVPHHYGGYYVGTPPGEPYLYWNAWSWQAVYDGHVAHPSRPWVAAGPYVWANGLGSDRVLGGVPGLSYLGALEYACSDFGSDGMHMAAGGAGKASRRIQAFFRSDSSARSWYLAAP